MGYYSSEFLFPLELVWNFTKCKHNMGYYSSESWISMGLESAFADYYKGRMPFWYGISKNPNITWNIICDNPDKLWNYWGISENPNITWDIICNNPDEPWRWNEISTNPNITLDIILSNPNYPWFWPCISMNPNITWDIIQSNQNKPWSYELMSYNPNITWDIIDAYPDKPWNKCSLYNNKFTAQAKISMAKHRLKAYRKTNYLARYTTYGLVTGSLEYGY